MLYIAHEEEGKWCKYNGTRVRPRDRAASDVSFPWKISIHS